MESIYPLNLETETESEMGELCVKNLLVCLLRCAQRSGQESPCSELMDFCNFATIFIKMEKDNYSLID